MDDLLIYNDTFEHNLEHVQEALLHLKDAGVTVIREEVKLAVIEISFLGHIVSPKGISIASEHTCVICDFLPPRDVRGVVCFVGMASFYCRFVLNFVEIAAPVNCLHKRGAHFQ